MSKKLVRLFALLFTFALVAAACGNDDGGSGESGGDTTTTTEGGDGDDDTEGAPDEDTEVALDEDARDFGGVFIYGLEAENTGMRPWEDSWSEGATSVGSAIYDRLMDQDVNGAYQGFLAEDLTPNEDLTVWVMNLRPDVEFSDGTPLTAQTIVDMFEVQKTGTPGTSAISLAQLDTVEATGDLEVTYTLLETNAGFPGILAGAGLGMVFEPVAAAADPDGFNDNPIGTGPFTLQSRDVDNETIMVRNPNYWLVDANGDQLPYLDEIRFRPIPDETTRLQSLQSGTVNGFETRRQATIRDTREAGGDYNLVEFQGNNAGGGHYNTAKTPFDDVRVRNGLTYLNNQEAVIAALGGTGISDAATQFFSKDDPYYSEAVAEAWPKFDVEKGTALIQEYVDDPARSDGKAVGESIDVELSCPPDPTLLAATSVLEQVWSATGLINVNLTNFDQATHIDKAVGADNGLVGDHGAHCWRWGSQADPATVLNPVFGPVETSGANVSDYYNPELDQLLTDAASTVDVAERAALYEEAGLIIARDTPIWFSGGTATMIATDADVKGFTSWILPSGDLGVGIPQATARWHQIWIDADA